MAGKTTHLVALTAARSSEKGEHYSTELSEQTFQRTEKPHDGNNREINPRLHAQETSVPNTLNKLQLSDPDSDVQP